MPDSACPQWLTGKSLLLARCLSCRLLYPKQTEAVERLTVPQQLQSCMALPTWSAESSVPTRSSWPEEFGRTKLCARELSPQNMICKSKAPLSWGANCVVSPSAKYRV